MKDLAKKHLALIVAAIGVVAVLVGPNYFGIADPASFTEMVLGFLTIIGVGIGEQVTPGTKPPNGDP